MQTPESLRKLVKIHPQIVPPVTQLTFDFICWCASLQLHVDSTVVIPMLVSVSAQALCLWQQQRFASLLLQSANLVFVRRCSSYDLNAYHKSQNQFNVFLCYCNSEPNEPQSQVVQPRFALCVQSKSP